MTTTHDKFSWTPARLDLLRKFAAQRMPFTEIAARLGTSKGSALGKAQRLGLTGCTADTLKGGSSHQDRRTKRSGHIGSNNPGGIRMARQSRVDRQGPELPLLVLPRPRTLHVVATAGAVPFRDLGAGQCRWIIEPTVPGRADFALACAAVVAGVGCVYCAGHADVARGRVAAPTGNLAAIDNWAAQARRVG